jgi:hypothetical protein
MLRTPDRVVFTMTNINRAIIQREAALKTLRDAENYGTIEEYYNALGQFNAACDKVRESSSSPRGKQSF